jgi:hypothetical protein
MRAIEFDSLVEGDVIRIPEQYRDTVGSSVRVILMPCDKSSPKNSPQDSMESVNALLGIIPDDFDLDEIRLERILGTARKKR